LVEILIVATITSVIAVGIVSTFMAGVRVYRRAQALNVADADVRLGLAIWEKDLRSLALTERYNYTGSTQEMSFPAWDGDDIAMHEYRFARDLHRVVRVRGSDTAVGEDPYAAGVSVLHADALELSYLSADAKNKTVQWLPRWTKEQGPFAGVRVRVKRGDAAFEKVVVLPEVRREDT
jgi:hypothetical protein